MGEERISRIVAALIAVYCLLTLAWMGALGWHLGRLMPYRPEADRAALVMLIAAPVLWGACQYMGQRRYFHAFLRASVPAAVFVACFAEGTRGHVPVLDGPVVAGFAVSSGLMALFACAAARIAVRLGGDARRDGFRLTRHFRYCVETLVFGFVAAGLAHLFQWRARVERPPFDPIEFPNAYSRSMDYWTYGFLLFIMTGALYLCWRASRLRMSWWNSRSVDALTEPDSTGGYASNPEIESVG